MNDESLTKTEIVTQVLNSKAAVKLAKAVQGIVDCGNNILDYSVGPNRIKAIADARAYALITTGSAEIEMDERRKAAAQRIIAVECRNQENIEAITQEALSILNSQNSDDSIQLDDPISEDFVFRFFEECKGVSDEQMQNIWAHLLAGEVLSPGSFHPRALRVVKDLTSVDVALFNKLMSFSTSAGLLVWDYAEPLYKNMGVTYDNMNHLQSLGLINHIPIGDYSITFDSVSPKSISYGDNFILFNPATSISIGKVCFTDIGNQLSRLCTPTMLSDFPNYIIKKLRGSGHTILKASGPDIHKN